MRRQSSMPVGKTSDDQDEVVVSTIQLTPSQAMDDTDDRLSRGYSAIPQTLPRYDILSGFIKGYNTVGRVVMDGEPWSAQNNPFYVLISIKGVSPPHAALRVFSKLLSIGVFTVGTAIFASTTLVTIMAAVVVATLVLVAGVFGRVTAMWMASEIMKDKPVIHRVVTNQQEAEQYMDEMLRIPDCIFEILGHVVVNGRCVKRYGSHMRWSKILGVLARPYDITRLAMPPYKQ